MKSCDRFMKPTGIFTTICAVALALPLFADPIDSTQYAKSIDITFPGYTGSTTLTDFPVLVRLSTTRNKFDYSVCQANGADLRFSDADGNLLSHEIDTWNTSGESLVWVKVPSLNASTHIIAYYGYTGDDQPPAVTASDVWSADFVGVWHMKESGVPLAESSGVSGPISTDSTGGKAAYGYAGAIGNAVDLSTSSWEHYLSAEDNDAFDGLADFTLEMWTKQNSWRSGTTYNSVLMAKRGSGALSYYWYLNRANELDGPDAMLLSTNGTGTIYLTGNRLKPEADVWTHRAFVRNTVANDCRLFIGANTYSAGSQGTQPIFAGSGPLYIGGWTGAAGFPGQIDEVRISRVARSADWIKATSDCVTDDNFAEYALVVGNDWTQYSRKFSVTFSGYEGSETLANFPVLVKISEGSPIGFSYADCIRANGGDLRFADADGNLLASEVDTWNPNGVSLIWVKVPSLTASTKITAYYGWDSAPAVASSNVWANGYVGVWHMNETSMPLAESSGITTPISYKQNNVVLGYASGAIGAAVDCSGATSWFDVMRADDDDDLEGFTAFTLEMWTKQAEGTWSTAQNLGLIEKRPASNTETSGNSYYWYENKDKAGAAGVLFYTGDAGTTRYGTGNTVKPDPDVWTHQAFVRTTGANRHYYYYVGGANTIEGTVGADDPITASTSYLIIGGSGKSVRFPGQIDEIRISRTSRSADWIKATSDTVTKANFATYSKARSTRCGLTIIFR